MAHDARKYGEIKGPASKASEGVYHPFYMYLKLFFFYCLGSYFKEIQFNHSTPIASRGYVTCCKRGFTAFDTKHKRELIFHFRVVFLFTLCSFVRSFRGCGHVHVIRVGICGVVQDP